MTELAIARPKQVVFYCQAEVRRGQLRCNERAREGSIHARSSGMAAFKLNLTIEVEQVGNGLAMQTPVPLQLVYHQARWQAVCDSPVIMTPSVKSLEEAIIAGSREIAREMQAAVIERPLIAGRITAA